MRLKLSYMNFLPDSVTIIILAAGKGTRMKSDIAKVLHTIAGRPMILYVVETAAKVAKTNIILVVGHQAEEVKNTVLKEAEMKFAIQLEQKGTGHAVICAMPLLSASCNDVVILNGDVPLIRPSTIQSLVECHISQENDVTVLAAATDNPYGYGRIILNNVGDVEKIVEETDATESEKKINIINSGIYCVKKLYLRAALSQIKTNNAQKEIYLTDIIGIARRNRKKAGLLIGSDQTEILGVNTVQDLQRIESLASIQVNRMG
jgi:UDP-N-acetylglucosamine diphosphorylase/glucosamine-1-phosphate N-acetyltransferase